MWIMAAFAGLSGAPARTAARRRGEPPRPSPVRWCGGWPREQPEPTEDPDEANMAGAMVRQAAGKVKDLVTGTEGGPGAR